MWRSGARSHRCVGVGVCGGGGGHRVSVFVQHLDGHRGDVDYRHSVVIEPGSRLAAVFGASASCNSRHHQCVAAVGEGLIVTARALDGTVEGLEHPLRRFCVCVQWHPEDLVFEAPHRRLFEAFASAAGVRATTRSEDS